MWQLFPRALTETRQGVGSEILDKQTITASTNAFLRKNRVARNWFHYRCSLLLASVCLACEVLGPAPAVAQIGLPSDPICRLRAIPDGEAISGKLEYDVKAALLYRCLELVQWPTNAFGSAPATLRIGIVGKNQFGESLDCLIGKTVAGRKLVVKRVSRLRQTSRFQLVFVSSSELQQTSKILNNLAPQPVLTMGEIPGFTQQGGMINLLLEGKSIRLEVNRAAAEKAGILLDPKLKQLAEALSRPVPAQNSLSDATPKS